ncbi:uncharacterized protein TNIN_12191 [Trichonephila inaurata madagascariensis]|uniref:Uncharacterized protein n=1 Tax=Trichonephila inaurata madagascariensis TaxID=2747483 RepID=A0A8X7BSL5_9ARAC|nr:uncharacterized protein TNIN_12191 [Trichonephila inaurata madagascariensis]
MAETFIDDLKEIAIPRRALERLIPNLDTSSSISLHVFCNASKLVYATCIYVRTETSKETICQLIQARSRVAHIKCMTVPRLELMACNKGARLAHSTKKELGLENIQTYYWSDSCYAVFWIKKKR